MTPIANIVLETTRLKIIPLSYQQLVMYLLANNSLENELGLLPSSRTIPFELQEPLQQKILPEVANTFNNYLYFTLWSIILKQEKTLVGDLCFKGPPNAAGEIEIGYGTYPDFQNNGYMTEAISAIIVWTESHPGITAITAETRKNNLASIRTLEKNNFQQTKLSESMIWWQRKVKQT